MNVSIKTLLTSAALVMLGTVASAATLSFDTTADCASAGLTITQGSTEGPCIGSTTPNGTPGLLARGAADSFWTVRFNSAQSSISIDLGDFGADSDFLFLAVYDSFNMLLGAVNIDVLADDVIMHSLNFSTVSDKIAWAAFGTQGGLGGIYADNLTFGKQMSAVPVPAAGGLLALGLAGLAALRRRKSAV